MAMIKELLLNNTAETVTFLTTLTIAVMIAIWTRKDLPYRYRRWWILILVIGLLAGFALAFCIQLSKEDNGPPNEAPRNAVY
jgi:O-antigen ligase